MQITKKNSTFAQFSKDLWLIAEHEGTKIQFDVDETELLSFANHLIDVAIDCLRKSSHDTNAVDDMLCEAMTEIEAISKTNPLVD